METVDESWREDRCPQCLEYHRPNEKRCPNCGILLKAGLKKAVAFKEGQKYSKRLELTRAQAGELKREYAYVPLNWRRLLGALQFTRESKAIMTAFTGMVSFLVGVAIMGQVGDFVDDVDWYWVPFVAGCAGFYGMFLLMGVWVVRLMDMAEEYLLDKRGAFIEQGEHLERAGKKTKDANYSRGHQLDLKAMEKFLDER
jgi:hypothetical protein